MHMLKTLCFSIVHGIARSFVCNSAALSARAVCALRLATGGIENGAGDAKDVVESSGVLYTNEEKGLCNTINTLLHLVEILCSATCDLHCSDHVSHI
jgi:hypothetical protein